MMGLEGLCGMHGANNDECAVALVRGADRWHTPATMAPSALPCDGVCFTAFSELGWLQA